METNVTKGMSLIGEMNNFRIDEQGHLYIDGVRLQCIHGYILKNSAKLPAELTITLDVAISQVGSGPLKL